MFAAPPHPTDPAADIATGRRYVVSRLFQVDPLAREMAKDQLAVRRYFGTDTPVDVATIAGYIESCSDAYVVNSRSGSIAGGIFIPEVNPYARHCFLSAYALDEYRGSRLFIESVILVLDYLFSTANLQRVRFDVLDLNLRQFERFRLTPGVEQDGTRKDWVYAEGQYWDAHLFSVSKTAWLEFGTARATRLRARRR